MWLLVLYDRFEVYSIINYKMTVLHRKSTLTQTCTCNVRPALRFDRTLSSKLMNVKLCVEMVMCTVFCRTFV